MRRLTIVLIPERASATRQIVVPSMLVRLLPLLGFSASFVLGFFVLDYLELREIRHSYAVVASENEGLKGEARILMTNLEEVKRSLRRVQDYTAQLSDLTNARVQKVKKETGIGPLNPDEYKVAKAHDQAPAPSTYVPVGLNMDSLVFRPVFDRLTSLGKDASDNALELQQLISRLSQQRSLLASIPSLLPVNGWITSGYGYRISPFTGERSMHMGIDVASSIGTPISAPADGVVIFRGAKEGFGNFVMLAHGYGIVTHYGHVAQILVQPGQTVRRGEQIATVGMTGRTTGPHLHFEVWVNGSSVNPKKFLLDAEEHESSEYMAH